MSARTEVDEAIVTPRKTVWTTRELLAAFFPEPAWAVPGIIPVGLTFLAGRPKLGKSWLALQIAVAVGTGGCVLGREVAQGAVHFMTLEDSPRRLQQRLEAQGAPGAARITFCTTWRPFGEGGFHDLENELARFDYRLSIIDTFSRAAGSADQSDPAEMTKMLGELQALAMERNMALVLIDHHGKNAANYQDPVDNILSSTAKAAVADCAMGLYREQGKAGTVLKVIGRDIEERELALKWDAGRSCWDCLGNADEVRRDSFNGAVLGAIRELIASGQPATGRRIATHLDKDDSNVSRALAELCAAGRIAKGPKQGREVPYLLLHK